MSDSLEDFSGNDKHYKMLRKALKEMNIALWNEFAAAAGPRFRADLRGMDLSGQNLSGAKLRGARLEKANLDRANLTGADLTEATLTGASLREAILEGTKLKVPAKVSVRKAPEPDISELDPEARRHRKLEQQREQAVAFLESSKKKEEALIEQKARVKAKNNPSPFTNTSR
ncbi:MAG: pentapeptide repeat-containing protein [Spirochaetales bacterium]